MNIIEAFDAVTAGEWVQHPLTGRVVVRSTFGDNFYLCWRDTGEAVVTNSDTRKDDAFEVIEPTWREATVREAFAALAEGKTVDNDRDMRGFSCHFTDDDILVNRHGDRVDLWSEDFEPGVQWYILVNY